MDKSIFDAAHLGSFVALSGAVFFTDMFIRKVRNSVVVFALVLQAVFLFAGEGGAGAVATTFESAVAGLAIGFVLLLPLYAFGAMGAGDVKFFAVVGWWLGPYALLPVFMIASLLAGFHALALHTGNSIWALAAKDLGERVAAVIPVPARWRGAGDKSTGRAGRGIPYAAYMAVGAVGMLVWQS